MRSIALWLPSVLHARSVFALCLQWIKKKNWRCWGHTQCDNARRVLLIIMFQSNFVASDCNRASNFKIGRARRARSIWNYELYYSLNCTTRGLIVSITNFGITNVFWQETSVALFIFKVLKTVGNIAKEAITLVSNYKKFKSDICNWTPTWSRRTNHDREFVIDTINNSNCIKT